MLFSVFNGLNSLICCGLPVCAEIVNIHVVFCDLDLRPIMLSYRSSL